MRYVVVPPSVALKNLATGEALPVSVDNEVQSGPWTMHRYLTVFVLTDRKLGDGHKSAKTVRRVHRLFKDAEPGAVVEVESNDWEKVKAVIETPSAAQTGAVMSQFVEFMDTWIDASETKPTTPAEE